MTSKNEQQIEQCTEYLQCFFTREEREDLSQQLARKISDLKSAELRKKEVVKALDADIAGINSTIETLATKVKDGYEFRNVDCELIFNYKEKTKTLKRLDTEEIVRTRPLNVEELQMRL